MTNLDPRHQKACDYICKAAKDAGGRALLVGGCVRDWLLGLNPKDLDVEIYGLPPKKIEEILRKKFHVEMVGKSFGVWILKGYHIDVSIPRRERKTGEGHKAFDVECDPMMSTKEACSRRDFTINAILCDWLTGEIIDPFDGRKDMRLKILRHTSERFREDPLRVLRAMQFAARFEMSVAPETVELCKTIEPENLAPERIYEEWKKLLLRGIKISAGLNFLRDCGWIKYFPELAATIGCKQDPKWHPEGDVFAHTGFCMDSFAKDRIGDEWEDLVVGFAVLCHDFGKPRCTKLCEDGKIRSHGHDILGVAPTRSFLQRLTREKALVEQVLPLVERHMAILDLWRSNAGDSAIRRLARKVGRIDRLVRIDKADRNGRPPEDPGDSPQGEWIMARAEALKVKDSAPKPIIMGRHLIDLGLKPSPDFGRITEAAYEAQLDGKFDDLKGGLAFVNKMLEIRP